MIPSVLVHVLWAGKFGATAEYPATIVPDSTCAHIFKERDMCRNKLTQVTGYSAVKLKVFKVITACQTSNDCDKSLNTMKQKTVLRHFMSEITTRCQQEQICTTFHLLTFNRSDFSELVRKPQKGDLKG